MVVHSKTKNDHAAVRKMLLINQQPTLFYLFLTIFSEVMPVSVNTLLESRKANDFAKEQMKG